jgi:serine protease Do
MSDKDWYDVESWYAPLKKEEQKKEKKHKNKTLWITVGAIALVLLLIIGTSVAFAGSSKSNRVSDGSLPDSWEDYFDSYYDDVQSSSVEIDIPRADPVDFTLNLEEPGETELSLQELYESCASSIVAITSYVDGEDGYYWGTGIIASSDGLIITNAHVIDGCDSAEVTLYNDESYEAKLVGADGISDIALLKIEASGLPVASFGDSNSLSVGDSVVAIGNPLGEEFRSTMTSGIVSAIDRGINYNGRTMNLIQTDTAINQGNSGGALFNLYGQVIGITNMKMMSNYSSIEGIGFAIPSSTVKSIVDALSVDGEVRGRPSIGITVGVIPDTARENYDLPEGLYISAVQENSDAAAKGIETGDILTAVNGVQVTTTQEVADIKEAMSVGDTLVLTIWRDGETMDIEVALVDTNDVY